MRTAIRPWLRYLAYMGLVYGTVYLLLQGYHYSEWNRARWYEKLLNGDEELQLKAASTLAAIGAESELLRALHCNRPEPRELARRALEHYWFNAAGAKAYRMMEAAYQASEAERFVEAMDLLDRLVARYPRYAEAWNRRASVLWKLGRYQESIADCERALALNPNHYGAWQGIGVCQLQLGEVHAACRCLRAALKIIPHDEVTRRTLKKCEELLRHKTELDQLTSSLEMI